MDERPIKYCACGKAHTRAQWDALGHLPDWHFESGEVAEVRNCTCGSTLVLDLPIPEPMASERLVAARAHEPQTDRPRRGRGGLARIGDWPFPMFLIDLASGAIADANDAAVQASGWAREAILAASVSELFPSRGPDGPTPLQALPRSSPWTARWVMRHRDGSTFFAEVALADVWNEGRPAVLITIITPQSAALSAAEGAA